MRIFNYYMLLFVLGSFLGFIIETIWCLIINHKLESRKGLIYSPLIPIYGLAALVISLIINVFNLKDWLHIFVIGMLVCLVIEYISSLFQEKLFHSKSWDYSKMPFNINGRVNLKYTLMFGIVAMIYSNYLLPKYNFLFKSIKLSILNPCCCLLAMFLIYDIIISCLACYRMKERKQNVIRTGVFWRYFDYKYNDQYLSQIYPNMKFI